METHEKIKELTEKIHREGVEKANQEAAVIIDNGKKEAERIVEEANKRAEAIIAAARKEADALSHKVSSEVRMSAQQAIMNLRQDIGDLIQVAVFREPLKRAFDDHQFVRRLIEILVEKWDSSAEEAGLEAMISGELLKEVEQFFREKAGDIMNRGIRLDEYHGTGKGFEIRPVKGNYKINITDEAFEQFLKDHFKPVTLEFLYGGKG
jgi:V/A-type H+-transporting ATPase subunit E